MSTNIEAIAKAHEKRGEQSEEAPLKSSMHVKPAEFTLESESELQASRNAEETKLQAGHGVDIAEQQARWQAWLQENESCWQAKQQAWRDTDEAKQKK